jgi:hypothetical protein
MKNPSEKIAYVSGFLTATLGSVRSYTIEDYKRRIAMAIACLDDDDEEFKRLGQIDIVRQSELDKFLVNA